MTVEVLEDKSTLLQVIHPREEYIAPEASLVTIYAVQPRVDAQDAARTLFRAADQAGVEIIRAVFPVKPKHWDSKRGATPPNYVGLGILVRVTHEFTVMAPSRLPFFVMEARRKFAQLRSMTFTMLEASGCQVTLLTKQSLVDAHLYGTRPPESVTIFKDAQDTISPGIAPFFRLDRVPSRHIQDFPAPDLPVLHVMGRQVGNVDRVVGFPPLQHGMLLIAGSNPEERLAAIHQLLGSVIEQGKSAPILLVDSHRELNGLVHHFKQHPEGLRGRHLQVLRVGTNIHLNLCDVIIPDHPIADKEAEAALKAHLISKILINALDVSDYMLSRYEMPLQVHLKKAASAGSNFTLQDVSVDITGGDSGVVEKAGLETISTDMFAIEQLAGILEQFRAYPEINYAHFLTHFGEVIAPPDSVTIFQLSESTPSDINRAIVAYLLHFLSQFLQSGVLLLTHAGDYLLHGISEIRPRRMAPKFLVSACEKLATRNLFILSSHAVDALNQSLGLIEAAKNFVYLRLTNEWDRTHILSRHQLNLNPVQTSRFRSTLSHRTQQQTLGIAPGEGLLFREDAGHNTGFHFALENRYPIDRQPLPLDLVKPRGSEILGLAPATYAMVMRILKNLKHMASLKTEMLQIITTLAGGQAERIVRQIKPLQLFQENIEEGRTFWVMTAKGEEFYREQFAFVKRLPSLETPNVIPDTRNDLAQLESFYDATTTKQDREDTNTHVKTAVGRLLRYLCLLRQSIPWRRVAEYRDLEQINGLEWQDFRTLFAKAYALTDNLLLETRDLNLAHSNDSSEVLGRQTISSDPGTRTLEAFLPTRQFTVLQRLSKELGLPEYPQTGIFDIAYELHTQGRNLIDEMAQQASTSNTKE